MKIIDDYTTRAIHHYLRPMMVLILVISINSNCLGQRKLITKEGLRTFRYDDSLYQYKELEQVLKQDLEAYKYYKSYQSKQKTSKFLGWSSVALIGGGILIGTQGSDSNCSSGGVCPNVINGVLMGLGGMAIGTIALVVHSRSVSAKRKSILTFNDSQERRAASYLELGINNNQIGLVYRFVP